MPKNVAGMNEKPPVIWKWGTFCRQVLVNPATGQETSLIGLLNGVDVTIETKTPQPLYEIPMMIWCHGLFKYTESVETDRKIVITSKLSLENQPSSVQNLEIIQVPGQLFMEVNLNLMMMQKGHRLLAPEGKSLFKMSFRYKSTDLGMVELPIKVIVKPPAED